MYKLNRILKRWVAISSIFLGLGVPGGVAASTCLSDNATFSGSIGSTTSCAENSGANGVPMGGCVVGSGGSSCIYTGTTCDFEVTVTGFPVGQSPNDSTSFSIGNPGFGKPTCQVKIALTQGNQGANFCQSIYPTGIDSDTMTTLGNKGSTVSHKQLEVCTDEISVTLSPPVISLEKKVVRVADGLSCADAIDQLQVLAPTEVEYCFTVRNDGQATADNLTLSDPTILPMDVDLGSLPGNGGTVEYSTVVAISDAEDVGEIVNTATVAGTFDGAVCDTCEDSDTATVNVVVECDPQTQEQANITGAVVETRTAAGISRCAPRDPTGANFNSVSLLCDGSCELRDECVADPAACAQPCKPSGNWTFGQNDTVNGGILAGTCQSAEPSPGNLALCQEVLGNPGNADCSEIRNPTLIRSDGHSITYGSNPILYYFPPGSLGGNSVGITYCILEPGEDASVCPAGSYVY